MKVVTGLLVVGALVWGAADAYAMAGGGGGKKGGGGGSNAQGQSQSFDVTKGSVPEPSTLYALGTGIALLSGAGWYIRRRK